ncbi:MAG: CAP domain-containing protein [Bdellovibrionales bacterium]|nr:CAP domain-containing protein [Ramlibacter sp.]
MNHLKLALLAVVQLALVGCGGGGGGGTSTVVSGPVATPASVNVASHAGVAYGIAQAHFDRLNEVRQAMGLRVLAWSGSLATAAQKHADYQRLNAQQGHGEMAGLQGFVAAGYGDRAAAAGFTGNLVGEVVIGGNAQTAQDARVLMDGLLTAPGHRFVLLGLEFTDAGVGNLPLTTEVGSRGTPWTAPDRVLAYPYNGQNNVALAFAPASETPNPLPGIEVTGMPLSVHAGMFSSFVASRAQLTNVDSGLAVELLPNASLGQTRSAFVLFPKERMLPNTRYSFSVELVIAGTAKTVTSTFTTGSN